MKDLRKIRKMLMKITRQKMEEDFSKEENIILRATSLYVAMKDIINLYDNLLKSVYFVNFPENDISADEICKVGLREKDVGSVGKDFTEREEKFFYKFVELRKNSVSFFNYLSGFIEKYMRKNFPNLAMVAGPIVGAQLIFLFGGARKLALAPSSKIQVIGAEKALFNYLKTGKNPPKYGVIYKIKYINSLKNPNLAGKMARFISNKIAIAIAKDYFGDKKKDESLLEEIEKEYAKLKAEDDNLKGSK